MRCETVKRIGIFKVFKKEVLGCDQSSTTKHYPYFIFADNLFHLRKSD